MSYTESQSRENEGKKKGKSESRHDRRFGKVFMIEIEKANGQKQEDSKIPTE